MIYVDVDGTLLIWPEPDPGVYYVGQENTQEPKINEKVVDQIKLFHEGGWEIVVWSANGREHAQWAVDFCGIGPYIIAVLKKPLIFIDDSYVWLGTRTYYNQELETVWLDVRKRDGNRKEFDYLGKQKEEK